MRSKPDTLSKSILRERIAAALSSTPSCVSVKRWNLSLRHRSARSWGNWAGQRFFAKTFIMEPYPVTPRPTLPGEAELRRGPQLRPGDGQSEHEWNMANEFRTLVGPESIPTPLGTSKVARTNVWQEVTGFRLYELMERSLWADRQGKTLAAALGMAGGWLRRLHDASLQGREPVDIARMVEIIPTLMQKEGLHSPPYLQMACRLLEAARRKLRSPEKLLLPVALNHGDFALANLVWDNRKNRLFIIDFEHAGPRSVCHDLFTIIFDLRSRLLNPLIPKRVILGAEESFWAGYGSVPGEIHILVGALASARIFYHSLPRLSTRRKRRGCLAGLTASLYQRFFKNIVASRRLEVADQPAVDGSQLTLDSSSSTANC